MMVHITKLKGDIAVANVIADLTMKGFNILAPVICEHLPFDLVAYKDNKLYKIQVKFSSKGNIMGSTSWADKNGYHKRKYTSSDFDYYAIYLPDKKIVIYPSITFAGSIIRTTIPNSPTPFYWYEDFIYFTNNANKKTYRDFNLELTAKKLERQKGIPQYSRRKVERPTKEKLNELLWSKPTKQIAKDFGISDKAIEKWAKAYNISKPPRGYWAKITSNSS